MKRMLGQSEALRTYACSQQKTFCLFQCWLLVTLCICLEAASTIYAMKFKQEVNIRIHKLFRIDVFILYSRSQ